MRPFGDARDARSFQHFKHVGRHVQRSNISSAPIAIDTHRTEKSICPIGGMRRRTRLQNRFAQLRQASERPGA
jgi:hypothetical protein